MDTPTSPPTDYLRLLRRILAKRWRLILLIVVGVFTPLVIWAMFLAPRTYEAVATIFIEDPRKGGGGGLLREWVPPTDASFQVAVLRSRSLAQAVAESLSRQATEELLGRSMTQDYLLMAQNSVRRLLGFELIVHSPEHRVLAELQKARTTFTPLLSGEVKIATIAYQPRVAMELANAYVEVLQSRSRSYAREEARATREFIESFLNQTKTNLQESEDALARFQRARGTSSISPQRAGLELSKLAQMENTLADIQATKEIAKVRLNFLRGGKDPAGKASAVAARLPLEQLRDRLAQLEEKLATLLEKYTEHHPLVVSTQAEIKEVQGSMGAALQSLQEPRPAAQVRLGPVERAALAKQMAALEVEISSLEAKEEVLKQRITTASRNLPALSAEEMETSRLLRRVESQRNLYALLSERLGTARIQEQAEGRGLRVIDLAALPGVPTSVPARTRILLGLLLALAMGFGVAAPIEYFNQPVETEDDVIQLTGLPVLGWLPLVEGFGAKDHPSRQPLCFVDTQNPRAIPAERCRSIRTSLESLGRRHTLKTVMLASPGPREGKSTVLLNLGLAFWELGRRLIVVDTDLRRPALHRALRSPGRSGVVDLLRTGIPLDDVRHTIRDDFFLLPAGARQDVNPGALLSADKVRGLLEVLKDRADLIFFDSAPVLAVSDNLTLASMVDGVIVVVRAGHTQGRDLIRAKDQLERVGARLLGVVINQVPPRETRRYYTPYSDYYEPGETLVPLRKPWNPLSWRPPRGKWLERKGGVR